MLSVSVSAPVCVECSLSCDCLKTFAFCKHSSNPRYNRSVRTFNRLPIYLGEDIIDKINKETIVKEINSINRIGCIISGDPSTNQGSVGRVKHGTYNLNYVRDASFREFPEGTGPAVIRDLYTSDYLCGFKVSSNDIGYLIKPWQKGVNCSMWCLREYREKQARIKNIRKWWKKYKHNKIMNKYIKGRGFDRIQKLFKDSICDYYFDRDSRDAIMDSKFGLDDCMERGWNYHNEVNDFDIRSLNRLRLLYFDIKKKKDGNKHQVQEQVYYLHRIGELIKNNFYTTDLQQSREYHYLGTYKSHQKAYQVQHHPKERWFLDLPQNFYKAIKYSGLNGWDIYSEAFNKKWRSYIKNSGEYINPLM